MSAGEFKQWLWPQPRHITQSGCFPRPRAIHIPDDALHPMVQADLQCAVTLGPPTEEGWALRIERDAQLSTQGYRLAIDANGAKLSASTAVGMFYGQLTLTQYLTLHRNISHWPTLVIEDHPTYVRRGAMVDLGRTVASLQTLKQLVRVLSRLRYNELHVRLYDDELCGLRFEGLPFGHENPYALTLDELSALAEHAREHHIALIPELESWGHVGSIVYHRPDLCGGEGMYGGACFRAGPRAAALVGQLANQVFDALADASALHIGFDEASWYPDVGMSAAYSSQDYLLELDAMRCDLENRLGREIELRLWADHVGRPLPEALLGRVTLQPWQYWFCKSDMIDKTIEAYRHAGQSWMMCVGQSQAQARGAYGATRYFCQHADALGEANDDRDERGDGHNLLGLTVALWGWNDWSRQLYTYFTGAYYAWNPLADSDFCRVEDYERFDYYVMPKMIWWQSLHDDTDWQGLGQCGEPLVWNGRYVVGSRYGQPVAPTVTQARTFPQQFYAEPNSMPEGETV